MGKRKKSSIGSSWIVYVILLSVCMAISPGACMILAAGMAPTVVAMVVTTGPSAGQRLLTVALFNLAGVFPFIVTVWNGHQSAGSLLSDVFVWGVMMGAAACGTAVNYVGPIIAAQVLTGMSLTDQRDLEAARQRLLDEWGDALKK